MTRNTIASVLIYYFFSHFLAKTDVLLMYERELLGLLLRRLDPLNFVVWFRLN